MGEFVACEDKKPHLKQQKRPKAIALAGKGLTKASRPPWPMPAVVAVRMGGISRGRLTAKATFMHKCLAQATSVSAYVGQQKTPKFYGLRADLSTITLIRQHCVYSIAAMDAGRLALLEAGIIRVVTSEEAATMPFGILLGGGKDALDDPEERFEAGEQALQSWHSRLPSLPIPGISLCQRCEEIEIALLKAPDGYTHSDDYWRLAASATECPMCALMNGALRGSYPTSDFETAMKLNNPRRTDQKIVLRACDGSGKKSEWNPGDEIRLINVEMTNMNFLPPGRLWVFALPGESSMSKSNTRKGSENAH